MVSGADVIVVFMAVRALVTRIVLRAGTVLSSVTITVVAAPIPFSKVLGDETALDARTETVLSIVTIIIEVPDSEAFEAMAFLVLAGPGSASTYSTHDLVTPSRDASIYTLRQSSLHPCYVSSSWR